MTNENLPTGYHRIMDKLLLGAAKNIHSAVMNSYDIYFDFKNGANDNMSFDQLQKELIESADRVKEIRERFTKALEHSTEEEIRKVAAEYGYGKDIKAFMSLGSTFRERTIKALEKVKTVA